MKDEKHIDVPLLLDHPTKDEIENPLSSLSSTAKQPLSRKIRLAAYGILTLYTTIFVTVAYIHLSPLISQQSVHILDVLASTAKNT
ncbi:hypothetical protein G7Y89_g12233 [Cudoniella acicularis]|uniref:Uncharacterized protein n=1 Tax=Cudoniella acicularis TaxID=354080 RepID=A0A8H4RBS9_9HELO|nr:hypothetical protein G7Y89_g12233 [Cudoniella acicularis]